MKTSAFTGLFLSVLPDQFALWLRIASYSSRSDALRECDSSRRWEQKFSVSKKVALEAVGAGQTGVVLSVVFDRLYVLGNQLMRGGST